MGLQSRPDACKLITMPELPDITAYISALEKRVIGQPLEHVRLGSPFLLRTVEPPLSRAEGRVVADRNRMTGGGVTAGIDFGLVLLARLRGDEVAKMKQLMMEYDPQPPFHAGSPKGAGPALTQQFMTSMEPLNQQIRQISVEINKGVSR